MKKNIVLTEDQLEKLINKVVKEQEMPRGGTLYSDSVDSEVITDIINRMTKFHTRGFVKNNEDYKTIYRTYVNQLKALNDSFPLM